MVGGTGNRSVVASANYEARGYGVRSAMPMAQARRLCPQAAFVPPRFDVYHRYSESFHAIALSFTPLVEGIGLDEVFLDVSGCVALFGSPAEIAVTIRRRVTEELGLSCSIGAGPSKLVAKLASKAAKPRASTPVSYTHLDVYKRQLECRGQDRKSTRLNSSHVRTSRMPSSA